MTYLQEKTINCIRILSAEMIEKAKSGHPGMAMGAAPIGFAIFSEIAKFSSQNSKWENRDRFILSAGHGSALLYSLFHIFNFGLTKNDLQNFRQLNSITPGHPEFGITKGVEATTGPLGQGFANAVGMAIAEAHLSAKYNKPNFEIVDHYTYVLMGDGCMQEGITYEAASFAGAYKLDKLIAFYDSNDISIEGEINGTFRENVAKRFEAQGWHVQIVDNANSADSIVKAAKKAKKVKGKPKLIICKTKIGFGSPNQGSAETHGAPLGKANLEVAKRNLNCNLESFEISDDIKEFGLAVSKKGKRAENKWKKLAREYKTLFPKDFAKYSEEQKGIIDVFKGEELYNSENKNEATRNYSGIILNKLSNIFDNFMGGSADLAPANKSVMNEKAWLTPDNMLGQNIHFGIREHAMSAICNGLALHGGIIPYCATFLIFSDYMKNSMRMSALMKQKVLYVLSHDSIGVGEDGPTHQPVEQLANLRCIPNMRVFRPCDYRETAAAYITALNYNGPTCIISTRQNVSEVLDTNNKAEKGGYILCDSKKKLPDLILISSGSEVPLCVEAKAKLDSQGIDTRLVSMPCMEIFEKQSENYKNSVLPKECRKRLAVEAASAMPWHKYVGFDGKILSMDKFGKSAPFTELFKYYGFTVENIVELGKQVNNVK